MTGGEDTLPENPKFNKIQKRIENLESEQAVIIRENRIYKKQKTLEIIQQNFTALLDTPEINFDQIIFCFFFSVLLVSASTNICIFPFLL